MKKLAAFCLFILCLVSSNPDFIKSASLPKRTTFFTAPAKGASSLNELANGLLLALQQNNFDQIAGFLPSDAELVIIKRRGSEDMKAVLENVTAADLKNTLKTDYETMVQTAIDKTLNWQDATVSETKVGKPAPKNKMLYPAQIIFTTKQDQPVRVLFETVKINNRFYLFRQMRLGSAQTL